MEECKWTDSQKDGVTIDGAFPFRSPPLPHVSRNLIKMSLTNPSLTFTSSNPLLRTSSLSVPFLTQAVRC
jgi:hypothetical protein